MHMGFLETSHTGARMVHLTFYQDLSYLFNLDLFHTYLLSWIHPLWLLLQTFIEPQLLRATFGWPKKPFPFYLSQHFRGFRHLNDSWMSVSVHWCLCCRRGLILWLLHPSAVQRSSLSCRELILLPAKYAASLAEMIWQGWNSIIRVKIWH